MKRKSEIALIGILVAIVMVGLVGVVSGADEFEDTVQYHTDNNLTDLWTLRAWYNSAPTSPYVSIYIVNQPAGYPYAKSIYLKKWCCYEARARNKNPVEGGEYWSFVITYSPVSLWKDSYARLYFYDEELTEINNYIIGDYIEHNHNVDLFEVLISEAKAYLVINSSSPLLLGDCNKIPSYIEFYTYTDGSNGVDYAIDDITTNEGIVGIGHESSPNRTITELTNYEIDTSWHVKTIPTADYTSAQYDLKVKRATWGEWYNVTNLKEAGNSSAKPCGFVVYNWSELFNVDDYGLYWFSVYKTDEGEATKIAGDWLFFRDIGEDSYINIEETEYAIGSPMNVSYWIGDPDFGANDYWIYMFDSSGEKVDELELYEQGGTHTFTSTVDWEEGTCYAVLIEDTSPNIDKDPPDDIHDLAYDFTWLSSKIIIRGHVWDATNPDNLVDGTPLSNVSVNFTHNNDWYNTTSDSDGYYEFIDNVTLEEMEFYKDIPITVTATKTGYNHEDYTMEIIRAGTYYVDLYLVPNERSEDLDNSSIAGLVLDLPFHQAIGSATVYMQNSTYYAEMTTNQWGFYSTDNIDKAHNETFNSSTHGSWVSLAHNNIKSGSEIVTNDITYNYGFDYEMNYTNGSVQVLATGNMAEYTNYDIEYDYYVFRENPGLGNNTYNMWAEKETYSSTSKEEVHAHDLTYVLENCDSVGFDEVVLDACDAIINNGNWTSNNTIAVNGTDYMEGTGSLQAIGNKTIDYMKNFTAAVDSNVTREHGLFYFYARILDKANISSTNVTIIIGSNSSNSTNTTTWQMNKSYFESDYWNLTILALTDGEEAGTCNLSAIDYFELKSTKTGNVTTKIDELKFIQWTGWDSNVLNLSADTGNKKEGSASVHGTGGPWDSGYLAKYFLTPLDATGISETGALSRIEFWESPGEPYSLLSYVLVSKKDSYNYTEDWGNLTGDKYGFLYWEDVSTCSGWELRRLYANDAHNINFTVDSLEWFEIILHKQYTAGYNRWIDYIQFKEVGRTYHNFYMNQYYNLTVRSKEMDTHNTITDFKAVWDSTSVKETTDGSIVFTNITYGIYPLEVTADGFYTSKQYIFMGQDTEETVYLMKIDEGGGGVGQYYPPPHLVEFRLLNFWSHPIADVNVTAIGYETTMGTYDWLWELFGYKNETQIHNTTMTGLTDSNGGISFLMVETIKYKMTFVKESEGINKTWYIYPKNEHYIIRIMGTGYSLTEYSISQNVTVNVTSANYNDTHSYINISYSDTSLNTENLTLSVNLSSLEGRDNETTVWTNTTSGLDETNKSAIVPSDNGELYYIRVEATNHSLFGNFTKMYQIKFRGIRLNLGFEDPNVYLYISFALLFFVGLLSGATSAPMMGLVVCLTGWIEYYLGWLLILGEGVIVWLSFATILSILYIYIKQSHKEGYP